MYKWLATVGMKNGQILKCLWESDKPGGMSVTKEIIPEEMPNNFFVTTLSVDGKSRITFRAEDISTLEITPLEEVNENG